MKTVGNGLLLAGLFGSVVIAVLSDEAHQHGVTLASLIIALTCISLLFFLNVRGR